MTAIRNDATPTNATTAPADPPPEDAGTGADASLSPAPQRDTVQITSDVGGIDTKDRGRTVQLAPAYDSQIEGHRYSGKVIGPEDSVAEKQKPKPNKPRPAAPKGEVTTDDDDIVVEYQPKSIDYPNGDEIVGRPRNTRPIARTEQEKTKGSATRKMVERHMADSADKIHGQKPTGKTSFDDMKTTTPPMSPPGAVSFAYKYSVGLLDALGNLSQHGKITQGQQEYARAYTAGFAHVYDATGQPPADWARGKSDKEIKAYESGMRAWQKLKRYEKEEFRVGESVKMGIPLDEMTGEAVKDSMMESWRAGRMGLYRGRDE